jgi:hypothetical protein
MDKIDHEERLFRVLVVSILGFILVFTIYGPLG